MIDRILRPLVYVLDSDSSYAGRLSSLLGEEGMDVRVYDSADAFLQDVSPQGPACVVLETELPRGDGLEVQRQLRRRGIDLPVLFFARRPSIAQCVAAIEAGAAGFLEKPAPVERLLRAIRQALEGHVERQHTLVARRELARRIQSLTVRERETLQLLLDGLSVKQISQALQIGGQTVAKHRARGLAKMQAGNDALLVRMCVSQGITELAASVGQRGLASSDAAAGSAAVGDSSSWMAGGEFPPEFALAEACEGVAAG